MDMNRLQPILDTREPRKCQCGATLSESDLEAGYTDLITGKPICEVCWEQGEPIEGPAG